MNEEILNLDKLSLEDSNVNVGIENSGVLASSHKKNHSKSHKSRKNDPLFENQRSKRDQDLKDKTIRLKRKHDLEEIRDEQMEMMARLVIEDSMTSALIRKCWKCRQSFVKESACTAVRCVCGATTCYSCGQRITNNLVTTHLECAASTTPEDDYERVRCAALRAKRALQVTHPSLTFKYDPSNYDQSDTDKEDKGKTHVAKSFLI